MELNKLICREPGGDLAAAGGGGAVARRVTGNRPQGIDDVDLQTDLKMPRLSIVQSSSKIVSDDKAKVGDLAHSITHENFGKTLEFIPLFMFKSRAQFEVGKGLVMMSRDNKTVSFGVDQYEQHIGKDVNAVPHGKDPKVPATEWAGKEPPTFSLVYNIMVILTGDRIGDFPMALSLLRTSAPTAKDFLSMVTFSGEDMFSRVYKISNTIEENEKGRFAMPHIELVRRCDDKEYEFAQKRFQEMYKQKSNISVDLEGADTQQS